MKQPLALLAALALVWPASAQENWSRFRGPNGTGLAADIDVPSQFSADDYAWQVDLPGKGHSSPVVWDNLVAVTAAEGDELRVLAYHLTTGEPAWSAQVVCPRQPMHAANNPAATTLACDARHFYLSYADAAGVYVVAFDHAGQQQWIAKLPAFDGQHGFASTPAVVGDVVCLNVDTASGGFLVAFDTAGGSERWRVSRPDAGQQTYSTPCTIDIAGESHIVAESTGGGLQAVDATSGQVTAALADVLPARTVSSPCVLGNQVFATCGSGGNGHVLVCAEFAANQAKTAFTLTRNIPYVPTVLATDDLLFLWHDQGVVTCIDTTSQQVVWRKRVGGNYYGSPICMGDRLIALSREGQAVVLAASRDYQLLAENDLGEPSHATPAVAQGRLLLRTESRLVCLGGGNESNNN
jgi:outer membrane protein assembly factor BamB